MPNDAKLGMAFGVGLVILASVLFFRKDAPAVPTATEGTRAVTPVTRGKRPPLSSTVTPLRAVSPEGPGPPEGTARKTGPGTLSTSPARDRTARPE